MNHLKQKFSYSLIVGILFISSATLPYELKSKELEFSDPEKEGFSSERLQRIAPAMQKYIDADLTPGVLTAIMKNGKIIYFETQGYMDVAAKKPLKDDAIFRIASMTKPIASIALMMLWEEGLFQLYDPVSKYIPSFSEIKVSTTSDASGKTGELVNPNREPNIRDMLTHRAGLANSYLGNAKAYDEIMNADPKPENNAERIDRLAKIPLNYHPGEKWEYSHATDVVGHLVEVISGESLDDFLKKRLFDPLDMKDTHFYLDDTKGGRLTAQYSPGEDLKINLQDPGSDQSRWIKSEKKLFSGSGGLVSTARDYFRFQQMVLNKGELDGTRILAPSTISLILENHTEDNLIWLYGPGVGFGLGYGVVLDRGLASTSMAEGSGFWGGAYCTLSWIDPENQLSGLIMTQLRPYRHINIRQDFQVLTYQALME